MIHDVTVTWGVEDGYVRNGHHTLTVELNDEEYAEFMGLEDWYEKIDFLTDWIQDEFDATVTWEVHDISPASEEEDDEEDI